MGWAYLLLLLAQTVQNFSLKLSAGGCSPGFCWGWLPFDEVLVGWGCLSSVVPSRPIVVVSGSVSGGGGGGGGCARRRGSDDMIVFCEDFFWVGRSLCDWEWECQFGGIRFACEDGRVDTFGMRASLEQALHAPNLHMRKGPRRVQVLGSHQLHLSHIRWQHDN